MLNKNMVVLGVQCLQFSVFYTMQRKIDAQCIMQNQFIFAHHNRDFSQLLAQIFELAEYLFYWVLQSGLLILCNWLLAIAECFLIAWTSKIKWTLNGPSLYKTVHFD